MDKFAEELAERIEKHISSFEHKVLAHHPDISVVSITEYAYVEEYTKVHRRYQISGYEFTYLLTEKVVDIINSGSKFKATQLNSDTIQLEVK